MWNPMGLVVSLMLIAAGAILVWAVTAEVSGLSIDAIGWILLVVGIIAFVLTLVLWSPWTTRQTRRTEYVDEAPARRRVVERPRREVVEDREVVVEDDVPRGPPPP
jgi:membrane protein implicated in regulation of membrane protease activity